MFANALRRAAASGPLQLRPLAARLPNLALLRPPTGVGARAFSTGPQRVLARRLLLATGTVGVATGLVSVGTVFADERAEQKTMLQRATDVAKTVFYPVVYIFSSVQEFVSGDDSPLLPPQQPDMYGNYPMTVVVGLEKTLVYATWSRNQGWRVRKRPGLDKFLETLASNGFEVVLWSAQQGPELEEIVMSIDKYGAFKHRLYQPSTNFKGGVMVKDLNRLNRDIKKVIAIDSTSKTVGILPPECALHIKEFTEDLEDNELARLGALLTKANRYKAHDLGEVAKKFNADPTVNIFAAEEALARESRRELGEETDADKKGSKRKKKSEGSSWKFW